MEPADTQRCVSRNSVGDFYNHPEACEWPMIKLAQFHGSGYNWASSQPLGMVAHEHLRLFDIWNAGPIERQWPRITIRIAFNTIADGQRAGPTASVAPLDEIDFRERITLHALVEPREHIDETRWRNGMHRLARFSNGVEWCRLHHTPDRHKRQRENEKEVIAHPSVARLKP